MKHIPRIYTNKQLFENAIITVDFDTTHHLLNVLRINDGGHIKLFNAEYGEWDAICDVRKKDINIVVQTLIKEPTVEVGFTVIFALIVPSKMHIILEKATELGAAQFYPIITEYTQNKSFNLTKAETIVRNAAEQCGRLSVPIVHNSISLKNLLSMWPENVQITVGDLCDNYDTNPLNRESCFLIGPEGGFSVADREMFAKYKFIKTIQIANNILRAETAAVAFSALCR